MVENRLGHLKLDTEPLKPRRQCSSEIVEAPSGYRTAAAGFVKHFIDKGGIVDVGRVADAFRMTKGQLAETAGLGAATVSKVDRRTSPRTQSRVTEMLEIISRVRDWAGGRRRQWPGIARSQSQRLMAAPPKRW